MIGCPCSGHFREWPTGHKEMVLFLPENRGDIASRSYNGGTALHMVVEHGKPGMIRLLLGNGANTTTKNYNYPSYLAWANRQES